MGRHDVPTTAVVPYSYRDGTLFLLDQRRLPSEESWIRCEGAAGTAEAIRSLAVRGAPLIGVAAAYGLAAEAHRLLSAGPGDLEAGLTGAAELLGGTRPTAVNLRVAVDRMAGAFAASRGEAPAARARLLAEEAGRIAEEDRRACAAIGAYGADLIESRTEVPAESPLGLLTHCNAGALATAGIGTALGVVRALAVRRPVTVFSDETRPFWQGARLTAWELLRDGIDVTILPDVAAPAVLASGRVAAVVVGADRIAANGDVANKVGTYGVALACRANGVLFVVAAPMTTVDLSCPDGERIPIEWRDGEEVLALDPSGRSPLRVAPAGARALYPAFDVTPAGLVDAIVTEAGVSTPSHAEGLARLAAGASRGGA